MTTDRQRDAEMDRLLASTLRPRAGAPAGDCPAAGDLAAFVEGRLSAAEKRLLEEHFSICDGCQQALAAIGRMPPAGARLPHPVRDTAPVVLWLRWLIPAGAAAALLLAYMTVRPPRPGAPDMQLARSEAPARPQPSAERPGGGPTPQAPTRPSGGSQESATAPESRAPEAVRKSTPEKSEEARAVSQKQESRLAAEIANPVAPPTFADERVRPKEVAAEKRADAAAGQKVVVDNLAFLAPPLKPAEPPASKAAAEPPPGVAPKAQVAAVAAQAASGAAATPTQSPPSRPGVAGQPPAAVRIGTIAESVAFRAAVPAAQNSPGSGLVVPAPDGRTKWRFERGAAIWRSPDAGTSWQLQRAAGADEILAGSAPTAGTCWAVGREGLVLLTADGEHWETRSLAEKVDLIAVAARDDLAATVTARDGRQFTTADGGRTWRPSQD